MHVKTNIEHNIIQVAIIAICPLFFVVTDLKHALFFIVASCLCFLISALVCLVFNKFLSRNIKIFITAILSTFIVTMINEYLKIHPIWGIYATNNCFFAVLSTICLCVDIYFIETKAVADNYLLRVVVDCLVFAALLFVYALGIEFLSRGALFGKKILTWQSEFFASVTFKFIWLALIGVFADMIYRVYVKHHDKKRITYQKFIKKIRDEKEFQYNELRRQKLLTSPVDVKHIGDEKLEEITQKVAENDEIIDEAAEQPKEDAEKQASKTKKKKRKKGKSRKVERVYAKKDENGGENK